MRKNEAERYPVELRWSDEDQAFIAEVYDLPGCTADGETEAEAIKAAHQAARLWIEVARQEGRAVPPPSMVEAASGKFNVRLPASLHRELQRRARREGVSLNQLVLSILAGGGGQLSVGPYQVYTTKESAIAAANTTTDCLLVVARPVVAKHGFRFLPPPWRLHSEDDRLGIVRFEHPARMMEARQILEGR